MARQFFLFICGAIKVRIYSGKWGPPVFNVLKINFIQAKRLRSWEVTIREYINQSFDAEYFLGPRIVRFVNTKFANNKSHHAVFQIWYCTLLDRRSKQLWANKIFHFWLSEKQASTKNFFRQKNPKKYYESNLFHIEFCFIYPVIFFSK